jgi:hypothetical protein
MITAVFSRIKGERSARGLEQAKGILTSLESCALLEPDSAENEMEITRQASDDRSSSSYPISALAELLLETCYAKLPSVLA